MFLFILTYKKPLDEVDKLLPAHRAYLDKNYASGRFIASGPRNPRVGGVIICRAGDEREARQLMEDDPFYKHGIADYEVIEFEPTKCLSGFQQFR